MTTEPEVIDGDAVPEADEVPPVSTDIVRMEGNPHAVIRADSPQDIIHKARAIADPLKELIESANLSVALDRRNPDRKHIEVGGWQATGALLGALGGQPLHPETVWTRRMVDEDGKLQRTRYTATVKRYHPKKDGGGLKSETTYDVDGYDWEAKVEIRTPDGTVVGSAEAMVSRAEETWSRRDDYANRSMAETRAESRAWRKAIGWIVHIAGYNPTPAEEMGHTPGNDTTTAPTLPYGKAASEQQEAALMRVLQYLLDRPGVDPATEATALFNEIGTTYELIPAVVAQALGKVAFRLREIDQAAMDEHPPTPPADPAGPAPLTDEERAKAGADEPPASDIPPVETPPDVEALIQRRLAGEQVRLDIDSVPEDHPAASNLCICPDPSSDPPVNDDNCPIVGHGNIPF